MLKIAWSTCQNRIYSKDQMVHFYINRPTIVGKAAWMDLQINSFPHLLQLGYAAIQYDTFVTLVIF